jgi:CRP-like cAMP-binding protein
MEPCEPETRDPVQVLRDRESRLKELQDQMARGIVDEAEQRLRAKKVRRLSDNEALRAVWLHAHRRIGLWQALKVVGTTRAYGSDLTGTAHEGWVEQLLRLEREGLIFEDGSRYWLTTEGHIAYSLYAKRRGYSC